MKDRLAIAVLCWLTLACTMMGLGNLIRGGSWQIHLIIMPLLITVAMWLASNWSGKRLKAIAPIGSVLAGLLVWLCYLCGVTSGIPLPMPDAIAATLSHLNTAMVELPNYGRPANNPELFLPLGLVGLGPMCLLADLLALGLRRPVWLGLPVFGCWVVFLSGNPGSGTGWVLASGASYLLLIAVAPRKNRPAGRFQAVALPLVVMAGVLGLLASAIMPVLPGWGQSSQWLTFWNRNNSDLTGINLEGPISVSDALRLRSTVELFRTEGDYTSPLQVEALDTFNGMTWSFLEPETTRYVPGEVTGNTYVRRVSFPDGSGITYMNTFPITAWEPGPSVNIEITNMTGRFLPAGVGPRAISNSGNMRLSYDSGTDSIRAVRNLGPGDTYTADTWVLDRWALRYGDSWAAGTAPPADQAGQMVPSLERIRELTLRVIGTSTRQDDRLQAIQNYLRGRDFTYTLAPGWRAGNDPIWDFLDNKQGYCVHFASAMAVMGWSIGIPMRVAVGYLPGRLDADGWRTVTGAQAHMWPQSYFEGVGWVSYEPTPAIGTEVLEGVALPEETPTDDPSASAEETDDVSSTNNPTANPTDDPSATGQTTWQQVWPWLAGVGGSMVGGVVVGLLVWVLYVNRYAPERAWRVIRRRGTEIGVLSEGMSLRTATVALSSRVDDTTKQDLAALRENLELTRYAPPDTTTERIPGRQLWKLKTTVVRSLRSGNKG